MNVSVPLQGRGSISMMSSLGLLEQRVVCFTEEDYVDVDNVRIIPGQLIFHGAYDGKHFDEQFRIINRGKYPAFVRIFQTTSQTFKVKPLPKGVMLSSGMSIVRHVSLTCHSSLEVPPAFIYIYINDKEVLYPLEVQLASSLVKVTPKILNFGNIDIGTSSEQLSVVLENHGQRSAHFNIDLGSNDLDLIVDPQRGYIRPGQKEVVKVEILGSKEGNFLKEFWVKTDPLQRIWITGTFIQPRLKIEYPTISNFDLIVIDFPKTYYNSENTRILIIKNTSSIDSMFCTVAESGYDQSDIKLDQARKINENLKFFLLTPKQGRLRKNHKAVINVTFAPYKIKTFPQKYCIIFIKIIKVNYRDGLIKNKDQNVKTFSSTSEADSYQIGSKSSESVCKAEWQTETKFLRICLYGEIEQANVKITPSVIDRNNLDMGEESRLTFNIENNSQFLSITFKYEKVACFEMEPAEATLKPLTSLDVSLILTPHSMGIFKKKISLVLYYKNRDGNVFKVGNAHLRVNYTARTKPGKSGVEKGDKDARNNYPINNANSTICSVFSECPKFNPPRDYNLTYTPSELVFKRDNNQKYIDFVRKNIGHHELQNVLKEKSRDYPASQSKVLLINEKIMDCPKLFREYEKWPKFIPLTPEELMDIEITPRYVHLGKIAPHIVCSDFFEIRNKNKFPIIINIIAANYCIVVKGKKRQTIKAQESAKVYFDCFSLGLGKYYVPVYISVNDFHMFDATVFAEVVPSTVRCKSKEIIISAKDNVGYLTLYNPVNCAIDFEWDVQEKNYCITPKSGQIGSRKSLYCKIIFNPQMDCVFKTDLFLLSQSGAKQIIRVSNDQIKTNVKFSTNLIEFQNTPLNMIVSRDLVVRNDSDKAVVLRITNPNPIKEVIITPSEGFLKGKEDMFFKITAHFKTITSFNCDLEFILLDGTEYVIHVTGNVTFPNVILNPSIMHIPKIVTNAYQRRIFRIYNNCAAPTKIKFLLDNYPDLSVTNSNRKVIKEINLLPKETVDNFLEFQPKEPTAYTLYLPCIINDLVGPALLNNPNSFKIGTYLEPGSDINRNFSTLRITCAAGAPWFHFSSLKLKFKDNNFHKTFKATNTSTSLHSIKFMVGEIDCHFVVTVSSCTGKYKNKNNCIKAVLEPLEMIELMFVFTPRDYGTYSCDIPFFIREYFENCPFNYIRLIGFDNKPIIRTQNRLLTMPTIPPTKTFIMNTKVYLEFHKSDCIVSLHNNHEFLKVDMNPEGEALIIITVSFVPKVECNVVSEIIISCTCEATCTLLVTAECDNCSLLCYRHKMKWWSDELWSHENTLEDSVCISKNINRMREIMQEFVFTQGYFTTYFFKIPENISKYPFNIYANKELKYKAKQENKKCHAPIVTLIQNMISPGMSNYLTDGTHLASLDNREGIVYDYSLYKNLLNFLETFDVFTKNMNPELFLSYERYVFFKTECIDEESLTGDEVLNEDEFLVQSKACWSDLLVKIYKLIHYDRLLKDEAPRTGRLDIDDIFEGEFRAYYKSQISVFPSHINQCEKKLMLWAEFHFKTQKDQLWPDKKIPDRLIRNLCTDLRDSLPFATLLASYCPYLADSFACVYFDSDKIENCPYAHNACLILEACNKLQLSFLMSSDSIFEPTNTEMIFLLAYLYTVLPSFYPLETVSVNSPLGNTSSVKVSLKNSSTVPISYAAIMFSNANESFSISNSNITIPPKGERNITISYTAKDIIRETAVLVLSGESRGQKYSKSKAINLVGNPDILYYTQEIKVRAELYETLTRNFDIVSPYTQPYYANTYFNLRQSEKNPQNMNEFVSASTLPGLPRQLELDMVCAFDHEGKHNLVINLCFIMMGEWTYYIYFINKEVGIFAVKITIYAQLGLKKFASIPVRIPLTFDHTAICKCKRRVRNLLCPRILYADIPFQNENLIEGLRNMIRIYARPDEVDFWDSQLVFPKGFHIFRAYLENTYRDDLVPFKKVLHPRVTYITDPVGNHFSVDSSVHFEDSTMDGTYRMLIHWDDCDYPSSEVLYLLADHGLEARSYKLNFWTNESINMKRTKSSRIRVIKCLPSII